MYCVPNVPPGETYPPLGDTVTDTSALERVLGQVYCQRDKTSNDTGQRMKYILVRNESGTTLKPGYPVRYQDGEHKVSISGYCAPDHPDFAGWVDPKIPSTQTVADNAVFLVQVDGPNAHFGGESVSAENMDQDHRFYGIKTDFATYVDGGDIAQVSVDAGGTIATSDAAGGKLVVTNDGDAEDESLLGTDEIFLFAANKPLWATARFSITEANTDDCNAVFGFVSGGGASAIAEDGTGLPSSYSGAAFFKLEDTTVWGAETSLAGTQDTDTDVGTRDGNEHDYDIYVFTTSATSATALFILDGSLVHESTFTYTSATEMEGLIGVHNLTTNAEVMTIDRVAMRQYR